MNKGGFFENLPEHLIQKILEYFQTKKIINLAELSDYEKRQSISRRRKNLTNGSGIKTDLKSIFTFSQVCTKFNWIIKHSDTGKLLMTIHYCSKEPNPDTLPNKLEHISYCHEENCSNVCHYVNKDIKHTNIIKK